MEVFLVPVAPDRYELYCEERDDHAASRSGAPPKGFVGRAAYRFREQIAEVEREHRRGAPHPDDLPRSFAGRLKARTLRWIAESIAEQRLLWQLRGKAAGRLVYPDDLTDPQARQLLRRSLTRDWERHRFWLVVNSLAGIGSILLVLLPGPNIIGYYFVFRIVGHYLALRGARQGLNRTEWTLQQSAGLTTLRSVVSERPDARADVVSDVESSLGLQHLATFFQRTAVP